MSRAGQIRIEFLFVVQLQSSSRSQRNAFKVNSDTIYNYVKLIIIYFSLSVIRIIFATNLCFLFAHVRVSDEYIPSYSNLTNIDC